MRMPIVVHTELYDLETAQPSIDAARQAFVAYLEQVPRKSSRSKYGLMGPVGKILAEIKSGRRDPTSLKGYAVRAHESAARAVGQTRRGLSPLELSALENGIEILVKLLSGAPITAHDRILDRLNYGLYFELRKKDLDSKESRRQNWISFLRRKYGGEDVLSAAWGQTLTSFEELYLPKKAEGARNKKATARQRDIAEFWESQGVSSPEEEEEI